MIVIPGPAIIYIMTKSIDQGNKAGIVSTLGIETGGLIHVLGAGFGISAIFMLSSTAFLILKYCGAIYLIYLGIKKLSSHIEKIQDKEIKKKNFTKIYYEGIIVNLFNPKTALFFVMFLPQFINEEKGNITSQILFLGILFIIICIIIDLIYVIISGKLRDLINGSNVFQEINKYLVGTVYLILGLLTIFINNPNHTVPNIYKK